MYIIKLIAICIILNNYILANILEYDLEVKKDILEKKYNTYLIKKKKLKEYYSDNNYNLYWSNEQGLKDISLLLLHKIQNDPVLKPNAKKIFKLDQISEKLLSFDSSNQENLFFIDFMLTELFDKYMLYLSKGLMNWKSFEKQLNSLAKETKINSHWDRYNLKNDPKQLLKQAIEEDNISSIFKKVDFNYPNVENLILAIDKLESISLNGGYINLPKVKSLRSGDRSKDVAILRARLTQSNDLLKQCENSIDTEDIITNSIEEIDLTSNDFIELAKPEEENSSCENYFDEDLKEAVKSFQKNHGLDADGIVGSITQKFLNISAEDKIKQIRLNLERMRWLPRDLGEKYLLVNIPEFRLKMIENNTTRLSMNVVVGEKKFPTPIFSDKMSYIVLNPKWNIPQSITKNEILPKLIKDPNYLESKGIDIYESWRPGSEKIDAQEIIDAFILEDLDSIPSFRLTQSPSPQNPLGRMKFMFPNKHAVYLHDTPSKGLFNNARRAYSHGCIRLSKPKELLSAIAQEERTINPVKVDSILEDINEKSLGLNKKIPIHIVYLTSWVDEEGVLQFREDIYNYDKIQKSLLY